MMINPRLLVQREMVGGVGDDHTSDGSGHGCREGGAHGHDGEGEEGEDGLGLHFLFGL